MMNCLAVVGLWRVVVGFAIAVGVGCFAAGFAESAEGEGRVIRDLTYVERDSGPVQLDLYLPDESVENPPLVIWVHGGGWQMGDRSHNPLADLTEDGYAVASISYRYSTTAPHPAQHHDCQAAIRWLRKHADEYGYDGERVAAVGGSAGAHLVGLLATAHDVSALSEEVSAEEAAISTELQAAVSFAGPMDLVRMGEELPHEATFELLEAFLDGPPPERVEVARQSSAVTYVDADDAPLLLVQGDEDNHVPYTQALLMHKAMLEAGATSRLLLLEGVGHDAGLGDESVRQIMKDFLAEHLRD